MTHNDQLREQIENTLIANVCALNHATRGAAAVKELPIPGTEHVMLIGARADVARFLDAGRSAAREQARNEAQWISVDERLPECSKKPGSLGVEVIVYPQPEKGESTAFFGCRITDTPDFYKYGSRVTGVTHWMPLPEAPAASKEGDSQ